MDNQSNEVFTATVSKYLNKFVNDIATNKDKVLAKLEEFPGKYHTLIEKAINEGPEVLPPNDVDVVKNVFAFIEYYSTGKISDNIEITVANTDEAVEYEVIEDAE